MAEAGKTGQIAADPGVRRVHQGIVVIAVPAENADLIVDLMIHPGQEVIFIARNLRSENVLSNAAPDNRRVGVRVECQEWLDQRAYRDVARGQNALLGFGGRHEIRYSRRLSLPQALIGAVKE